MNEIEAHYDVVLFLQDIDGPNREGPANILIFSGDGTVSWTSGQNFRNRRWNACKPTPPASRNPEVTSWSRIICDSTFYLHELGDY